MNTFVNLLVLGCLLVSLITKNMYKGMPSLIMEFNITQMFSFNLPTIVQPFDNIFHFNFWIIDISIASTSFQMQFFNLAMVLGYVTKPSLFKYPHNQNT